MNIKSQLAKYQKNTPLTSDELKQLNKRAIMDNRLMLIDLSKVTDIHFMANLSEYAEKEYDIANIFKGKR